MNFQTDVSSCFWPVPVTGPGSTVSPEYCLHEALFSQHFKPTSHDNTYYSPVGWPPPPRSTLLAHPQGAPFYNPTMDAPNYHNQDSQRQECSQPPQSHTLWERPPPRRRRTTRSSSHVCKLCNKCFTRRYNLSAHMETHNKDREHPFPCMGCTKRFVRKTDCERHYKSVHLKERPYFCGYCKQGFTRKDILSRSVEIPS